MASIFGLAYISFSFHATALAVRLEFLSTFKPFEWHSPKTFFILQICTIYYFTVCWHSSSILLAIICIMHDCFIALTVLLFLFISIQAEFRWEIISNVRPCKLLLIDSSRMNKNCIRSDRKFHLNRSTIQVKKRLPRSKFEQKSTNRTRYF